MPNWCQNLLVIRHEDEGFLREIAAELESPDQPLDFHRVVPVSNPDDAPGLWGTKANANFKVPSGVLSTGEPERAGVWIKHHELTYRFGTAWSPPAPIVTALAKKFADIGVELTYADAGLGFAGQVTAGRDGDSDVEMRIEDVLPPESTWF